MERIYQVPKKSKNTSAVDANGKCQNGTLKLSDSDKSVRDQAKVS